MSPKLICGPLPIRPTAAVAVALAVSIVCGCDSTPSDGAFPLIDAGADGSGPNADADNDADGSDGTRLPDEVAVPIALDDYIESSDQSAQTSVYQVESEAELADGVMVEARPGDWVLENDRVKLFLEGTDRAMSPCPWGGDIVDAQYKSDDGTLGVDVTGEICLTVNVGQTFAPNRFDVVADGTDGGAAILAVSGRLETLDFLDISSMAADYAPGILDDIPIDPDAHVPAAVTRYFVLQPHASGVKVVTALRNDGDERLNLGVGHLVRGGAYGHYFNPLNKLKGWGYTSLGINNLTGNPLPFVAYSGADGGYAYVPKPDPSLRPAPDALPRGGTHVSVAGATISILGRRNILETLLANEDQLETMEGLRHLEPGDVDVIEHWEYFGDGTLASLADAIYPTIGATTGTLVGQIVDADQNPVADALATAVDDGGHAMNQTRTDADGRYQMVVPVGNYHVLGRVDGRVNRQEATAEVAEAQAAQADIELKDAATLEVTITTAAGSPTPGRVTVFCDQDCPDMPTSQERDITVDGLPDNVARIRSVGVDGQAQIELPAGSYRVTVDRGMEWSIWPQSAPEDGGHLVELSPGQSATLDAEIAHVVDTSAALTADFHVHGVTSADSTVRQPSRVLDFMGEGIDVLISTDHDYISDYAPAIDALGANDSIESMVGVEMTTPHIGHFNTFPLIADPAERRRGAVDWARGTDFDMTPAEIFAWADQQDGDPDNAQVKQINHAGSTIPPLKADVLRGTTGVEPAQKRMDPSIAGVGDNDTGLWSDDFNAFEVMNGQSMAKAWKLMRWWLEMVSRGFTPTATAVTDTHKLYSDLGGSPRTFVFVGDDHDTVASFDEQAFVQAATAHRALGTNGPFFRVELENAAGDTAGLGETVSSTDGEVTAHVSIDVPEWMHVDTVDIFSNLAYEDVYVAPGETDESPIEPTISTAIDWQPGDLVEAASGGRVHRHRTKTVDIPLTIDEDAYVVVVVRDGSGESNMWPVIPDRSVSPFSFANPVFVDADGGGYDHPPLAERAQMPAEASMLRQAGPEAFEGPLTPRKLGRFIDAVKHDR